MLELKQKDFIEESSVSSPFQVDKADFSLQELRDELARVQLELEGATIENAAVDLQIMEMNEVHDEALEELNQIYSPIKSKNSQSDSLHESSDLSLATLKEKESK